jgi:hypothetical protein
MICPSVTVTGTCWADGVDAHVWPGRAGTSGKEAQVE